MSCRLRGMAALFDSTQALQRLARLGSHACILLLPGRHACKPRPAAGRARMGRPLLSARARADSGAHEALTRRAGGRAGAGAAADRAALHRAGARRACMKGPGRCSDPRGGRWAAGLLRRGCQHCQHGEHGVLWRG